MVKKAASIVFQVRFDDKAPGASGRLLSLYRQLRRKRQLAKFCRDAFVEKALRLLEGQEHSYQRIDNLIKSKGVAHILETLEKKEVQVAQASAVVIEDAAAPAEAVSTGEIAHSPVQAQPTPAEPAPELAATNTPEEPPLKKADLEKLKGLL
jgi:hypothetical protein